MADKKMEAQIYVQFTEAASRQSLDSGESITTLWGKVKKWLSDLKTVCFSGSYNDLSDTPTTATTDTDGLMSAEDKGKLDAFEITTTGGKLHDKDIATTETLSGYLPLTGGMTTGTTGLAGNFRVYVGEFTRVQFLLNGAWATVITGDNTNNGIIVGNLGLNKAAFNVDDPSHAYINSYPIYSEGYKPYVTGNASKTSSSVLVDVGFKPCMVIAYCGTTLTSITLSDTGFGIPSSAPAGTYYYIAFR